MKTLRENLVDRIDYDQPKAKIATAIMRMLNENCDCGNESTGSMTIESCNICGKHIPGAALTKDEKIEQQANLYKRLEALKQQADKLAEALELLIFTCTKLWNEVKPIKDSHAMTVTHPVIEDSNYILIEYKSKSK